MDKLHGYDEPINPGSTEHVTGSPSWQARVGEKAAQHDRAQLPRFAFNENRGIGLPKSIVEIHQLGKATEPQVRERAHTEYPGRDVDVHLS